MASTPQSRREFVADVGRVASFAAITTAVPARSHASEMLPDAQLAASDGWDLSWTKVVAAASDRAVFDWPSIGDPSDPLMIELAQRYLDNCKAAYAGQKYTVRVVMNIRTTSVPAGLNDQMWQKYSLGEEYKIEDPETKTPAVRNPFGRRPVLPGVEYIPPSLADLQAQGAILLVCDFALGHLAKRLAEKRSQSADDVHAELRRNLLPGAFPVPSGIFGMARAQNAGCALVRV